MWINLTKEHVETIISSLGDDPLAEKLAKDMADRFDASNGRWVQRAFNEYYKDGEIEVDQQADGSALIAHTDDGGAYVMAWVWVAGEGNDEN